VSAAVVNKQENLALCLAELLVPLEQPLCKEDAGHPGTLVAVVVNRKVYSSEAPWVTRLANDEELLFPSRHGAGNHCGDAILGLLASLGKVILERKCSIREGTIVEASLVGIPDVLSLIALAQLGPNLLQPLVPGWQIGGLPFPVKPLINKPLSLLEAVKPAFIGLDGFTAKQLGKFICLCHDKRSRQRSLLLPRVLDPLQNG